jgi:hypothetical protein
MEGAKGNVYKVPTDVKEKGRDHLHPSSFEITRTVCFSNSTAKQSALCRLYLIKVRLHINEVSNIFP